MKLVSYLREEQDQLALLIDGKLYDTDLVHPNLPSSMSMFLNYWEDLYPIAITTEEAIKSGKVAKQQGFDHTLVQPLAPVPHPTSCRIGYTFRSHSNHSAETHKPFFYFINHNSICGAGEILCMPDHLNMLDFEMQVAAVIGKPGKNIAASEADEYIAGFMIMNSFNARGLQPDDMMINPGPGKDFATATGPMLVTPDEMEGFKIEKENRTGNVYKLSMKCLVNGVDVCEGNLADMDWTFAEIIERCSYGVQLFPGDIIGTGPTSTGSFFHLNKVGKLNHPDNKEWWLNEEDIVEIEIENLGKLINKIVKDEGDSLISDKYDDAN